MIEIKKSLKSLLMTISIVAIWSSIGMAEVGYVNILNGIEPDRAFVVERQGQAVVPDGIYTNLDAGDVVKPSAEAVLLFTPTDTACEVVEIKGEFTATPCPVPPGGLTDAAYDFVANEFLAAPDESVGIFATRGANEERFFSLPPKAIRLFVENPALAQSLTRTPFLSLFGDEDAAEIRVTGRDPVKIESPGQADSRQFNLKTELLPLRQALLSRINLKIIDNLASPWAWPDFEWTINVYGKGAEGVLDYEGEKLALIQSVKAGQSALVSVEKPCVLTFKLSNRSSKPYYAYLLNYTPSGLLLPLLPSSEAPQLSNLISAGADLSLENIFLELGEANENVRLIVSENPLDLKQFNQDSLDASPEAAAKPGRLRPVPEKSWHTSAQAFQVK